MNKSSMHNPSSAHEDGKIADQAKQAVTHVASNVASQAKEQVNAQFDTRKDKAVETIGNVATAIRETGDKLKGVGPLGDVAGRAADGMEKVADFFEGKQIGDVVRDVERFARREPAIFIGAAFALGLIGGRFLKSSAHRSSGGGMGQSRGYQYARSGAGAYDDYEPAYGSSSSFDDQYDYLSDADLQDDVESQRAGSYGSQQRVGRTTQPFGSRGSSSTGSSMSGSSQGSSFGATQGSPAGSSFGTSSGSSTSSGSFGTSSSTAKTSSTPPGTGKTGSGNGNTGSV